MASETTEKVTPAAGEKPQRNLKSIILVGSGQAVESYDFLLFGLMSPFIGAQFFAAADSAVTGTLNALAIYGVGFVFRPLGAALFGTIADRIGRRPVMLLSVAVMAIASIIIGLMPTAQSIGTGAVVILVLLRILQGLAFGVEAPLNATYNVELGKQDNLGKYAGIIQMFVQIGLLAASLVAFFTSLVLGTETMGEWGWRVPFVVGGILGLVVLVMRRGLPETLHEAKGETAVQAGSEPRRAGEIWRQVWRYRIALLATIFVVGGVQILNYTLNVALPSVAQSQYKVEPTVAFAASSGFGIIILVLSPIFGRLADRWKVSRSFVVFRWILVPAAFLLLLYTGGSTAAFVVIMLVGAVLLAPSLALFNVIGASLVPAEGRTAGAGLAYSLGVAIFGGTASFVFVWAQINDLVWLFCVYGAVVALLSIVLYRWAVRSTGIHGGR
ncbi:MFS transporter [soil metagenome]